MIDWFVLLTPVILLPLFLMFEFVGCGLLLDIGPEGPLPPSKVRFRLSYPVRWETSPGNFETSSDIVTDVIFVWTIDGVEERSPLLTEHEIDELSWTTMSGVTLTMTDHFFEHEVEEPKFGEWETRCEVHVNTPEGLVHLFEPDQRCRFSVDQDEYLTLFWVRRRDGELRIERLFCPAY